MSGRSFAIAFAGVFAAELLGDKLLYTTGALATRYRPAPMIGGIGIAFAAKMGVAVVVGRSLAALHPVFAAAMTAMGFLWAGAAFWKENLSLAVSPCPSNAEAAVVSFTSVMFIEWGDIGQIAAANLAVQLQTPFTVWVAAVSALLTKAALAALVGGRARSWIERYASKRAARLGRLAVITVLGVSSVIEVLNTRH